MEFWERLIWSQRGVSPVIGTILMVAVTVVMAAIIGGFVYQMARPQEMPNLVTSLQDDERVVLVAGTMNQRIAKLTVESGQNIATAEFKVVAMYTDGGTEYTVNDSVSPWTAGWATPMVVGAMGEGADPKIRLKWIDSDDNGELSPGDRLDFMEYDTVDASGREVTPNTDFTVKIIHKSSKATISNHTVKVY